MKAYKLMSEVSNRSSQDVRVENRVSFEKVETALQELINELNPAGLKPQVIYFDKVLDNMREFMIRDALKRRKYVQTTAARQLGINRNTVKYYIKKYGIEKPVQ